MSVNFRRFGLVGSVISVGSVGLGLVMAFTDIQYYVRDVWARLVLSPYTYTSCVITADPVNVWAS